MAFSVLFPPDPRQKKNRPLYSDRFLVGEGGFEPPKAKPADLQSVPFGHSGRCGAALYDGDEFYAVNGCVVCEDCLPGFAREEYRSFRLSGREWRML